MNGTIVIRLRIPMAAAKNPDAYNICEKEDSDSRPTRFHQPAAAPKAKPATITPKKPQAMYASPTKVQESVVTPSSIPSASSILVLSPSGFPDQSARGIGLMTA